MLEHSDGFDSAEFSHIVIDIETIRKRFSNSRRDKSPGAGCMKPG